MSASLIMSLISPIAALCFIIPSSIYLFMRSWKAFDFPSISALMVLYAVAICVRSEWPLTHINPKLPSAFLEWVPKEPIVLAHLTVPIAAMYFFMKSDICSGTLLNSAAISGVVYMPLSGAIASLPSDAIWTEFWPVAFSNSHTPLPFSFTVFKNRAPSAVCAIFKTEAA